jgi:tRNA A37 threonylcarbamoyladenosine synthetase subunit TsaC/SUA5/YrdC
MGYIIIYQIFKQTHVFHQYVIGSIFQTQKSVSDIQQKWFKDVSDFVPLHLTVIIKRSDKNLNTKRKNN